MATRDMPWVPANMTPDRRKRLEAYSRLRRISRSEAAGLLIDAGIEAMKPVIAAEIEETRAKIHAAVLPKIRPVEKAWIGERFQRALAEPEAWCISGRCDETNWGGHDRLHVRDAECPPFDRAEIEGYLARASRG